MTAPTTIPALVAGQRAQVAAEQVLRDAMQATHSPSTRRPCPSCNGTGKKPTEDDAR